MAPSKSVFDACCCLLLELDIHSNLGCYYAIPFANYIIFWPYLLPIKTVIV